MSQHPRFSEAEARGISLLRAGRSEEAAVVLREAVAQSPHEFRLRMWLADAMLDLGAFAEIPPLLEKIPESARDCDGRHWRLGEAYSELGRSHDAECSYRRALETNDQSALCWAGLGYALAQQGKRKDAIDALRRVTELDPEDRDAHAGLATNLFAAGRLPEAEAAARQWVEISPDEADAWHTLGACLPPSRRAEAKAAFDRALALDPKHPLAQEARAALEG